MVEGRKADYYLCSYHVYVQAYSQPRTSSGLRLNDNGARLGPVAKNNRHDSSRRVGDNGWSGLAENSSTYTKMVPEQITETVAVVKVPNYEEKYVGSVLDLAAMKRYNEKVYFEPAMAPMRFAQTIICYKNSTRKRYVSRTFYEPCVKPKECVETTFVYPKRQEKTFVSFLDYHIDECRKWFKTCLEFKAKTYTATKIVSGENKESSDIRDSDVTEDISPGASQVFLPRFNTDGSPHERKMKFALKPDINQNTNPAINGY